MTEPPTIVINREAPAGRKTIQAYGNGGFTIDRVRFEGSVLVFPLRVVAWPVTRFDEVTVDSVADALSGVSGVELLLVGCGTRGEPAPAALRDGLREAGVVADFMDTGAACRTFNVLMSEDRRAAAALIAVE